VKALRVLLVEDDVLIGALLAELLSILGHHVCATAQTESDAVAAAAQHGPDLILLDIMLKQGDGISGMRRISQTHDAPHVFMTGGGRRDIPEGAVILYKPFCHRRSPCLKLRATALPDTAKRRGSA
jgi:CheY-like chemotaxis protein